MRPRLSRILALLAWATLIFAPAVRAQQTAGTAAAAPSGLAPILAEAQTWLSDLVRINTVNPPGNDTAAAQYVAAVLQKENIPTELLNLAPGHDVVIARLQANPLPDSTHALLLVSHLDVAAADKSRWTVDPFGATVQGGYLYGRGTLDDKGMVAAELAVMVALKRNAVHLGRDVIFLADDDQGVGSASSIRTLTDKYWNKIACAFAINDGGRVVLQNSKVQYVGVQASEKVPYDVAVVASAAPSGAQQGGSAPPAANPIVHLAQALAKIATFQRPVRMTPVTETYFDQLAQLEPDDIAKWMHALETPDRHDLAALRLSNMSPLWDSMLHDSVTPTGLQAGSRAGAVPPEARADLTVRLFPGVSIEALVAQLTKLVNDPLVRFQVQPYFVVPAPPSSLETSLYRLIEIETSRQFPGAVVVPEISDKATDSAELRLHNVQAYGLSPFPVTESDARRMNASDERISLDSFHTGTKFLYRIVHDFVAATPN